MANTGRVVAAAVVVSMAAALAGACASEVDGTAHLVTSAPLADSPASVAQGTGTSAPAATTALGNSVGGSNGATTTTPLSTSTGPAPTAGTAPTVTSDEHVAGVKEPSGVQFDVAVPLVSGMADSGMQGQVNTRLRSLVEQGLDDFVEGFGTEPIPVPEGANASYLLTVSPVTVTASLLSLRFDIATYSGGAHGLDITTSVNIDLTTGEDLALDRLFTPGVDVYAVLAPLAREQLTDWFAANAIEPDESLEIGTEPVAENYATWFPASDGLRLVFGEYQVGPYAIGMPEIVVPWSDLSAHLDRSGPAGALSG